ncbi:MAG: hypothetical protein AAGM67_22210, partial [Bacteroidota bacterium]
MSHDSSSSTSSKAPVDISGPSAVSSKPLPASRATLPLQDATNATTARRTIPTFRPIKTAFLSPWKPSSASYRVVQAPPLPPLSPV